MKKYQGSMTVEAGAVLPLFMIGIMSLISINLMLIFQLEMQQALYNTARSLSMKCANGYNEALSSVSDEVINELTADNVNFSIVKGGKDGLDFDGSFLNSLEYIEVRVEYSFLPFGADMFGLVEIPISQTSVMHIWNGYNEGFFRDYESEYVYVADDSEVYHRDRECSHIKLSIKKVSKDEIASLRNEDGRRYYRCELCHSKESDSQLFITTDGTKYHNKITCAGLKRSVRAIKLTEVLDRRPCKRCGEKQKSK